jgi:hypothetical protein
MALWFETTGGTPPVGGFARMPFASRSPGADQPLLNLGVARPPARSAGAVKGAVTVDGDVVVPLDASGFRLQASGFRLQASG